jgi:hypothetical protein
MIAICISCTRGGGSDFCAANIRVPASWALIRQTAELLWSVFPGKTIQIPEEMSEAFIARLRNHQPKVPSKPVTVSKEVGEMPSLPVPELPEEFGGFTLTFNEKHMIVFRYNFEISSGTEMLEEVMNIYLMEFIVRSKLSVFGVNLIPNSALDSNKETFMVPIKGGVFFNFHNHILEDDMRNRFLATLKQG